MLAEVHKPTRNTKTNHDESAPANVLQESVNVDVCGGESVDGKSPRAHEESLGEASSSERHGFPWERHPGKLLCFFHCIQITACEGVCQKSKEPPFGGLQVENIREGRFWFPSARSSILRGSKIASFFSGPAISEQHLS